jgi:hypothetical protein
VTEESFLALATHVRAWIETAFSVVGADGSLPPMLPAPLEVVADNYACWRTMRGEHDLALHTPRLKPEFVEQLRRLQGAK